MKKIILYFAICLSFNILTSCNNTQSSTHKATVKVSEGTDRREKIGKVYEYDLDKHHCSGGEHGVQERDAFGLPDVYVKVIGGEKYYRLGNGKPCSVNPKYGENSWEGRYKYIGDLCIYQDCECVYYFNFH